MSNEVWKPIPNFENYQVSNLGRVVGTRGGWHFLKQRSQNGYRLVTLYRSGKAKNMRVHRLVMAAFVGRSDLTVNHIDGDRSNNRLDNLEYCTAAENMRHSIDVLGSHRRSNATLTPSLVSELRTLAQMGAKRKHLAQWFNISYQTVCDVIGGRTWKTV